jgi:predicted Zn-dependent protease
MLVRGLLALGAILVIAWVGVLLRDHHVSEAARPLYHQPEMSGADFDRNIARLVDARFLNPDSSLDLARSQYLMLRGRFDDSARVAKALVRAEPDNAEAWQVLYHVTERSDPRVAARAAREFRRLNPLAEL